MHSIATSSGRPPNADIISSGVSNMRFATMKMNGETFVLVPQEEFDDLCKRTPLPDYPPADTATIVKIDKAIKKAEGGRSNR